MIDLKFISQWFFIWYILYILNLTKYNPKIWLIIISIFIVLIMCILIYYKKYKLLFEVIIINTIIKFIPLWTILHTTILMRDFYVGLLIFIIYNLWLMYHDTDCYSFYYNFLKYLIYDK
jgi:hypothetical protein